MGPSSIEGGGTKPSGISGGLKGRSSSGFAVSKKVVSMSSVGLHLEETVVEEVVERRGLVRRGKKGSLVVEGRREKEEEEERREREERAAEGTTEVAVAIEGRRLILKDEENGSLCLGDLVEVDDGEDCYFG